MSTSDTIATLRSALEAVEWVQFNGEKVCPRCRNHLPIGALLANWHDEDCGTKLALGEFRNERFCENLHCPIAGRVFTVDSPNSRQLYCTQKCKEAANNRAKYARRKAK